MQRVYVHKRFSTFIDLCDPHVPEEWGPEFEDIADVPSESGWLSPLSPWNVCRLGESEFLYLSCQLLPLSFIGRAHPVADERVELRDVRPAEPGARAGTRYRKVHRWIHDVSSLPP